MDRPLLAYRNVEISYDGVAVVHDVSFDVEEGQVVCVVGESGSGKSSLIRAAMGLLGPGGMVTRGDIWYGGRSLPDLSPRELRALCGHDLALVFQDSLASFAPIRRIGDQAHESLSAHTRITRSESDERAARMFLRLGLDDPRRVLGSYPFELSGGMGQRVGIALALLPEPRILLADEPTSALDVMAQARATELLRQANHELGTAIVLVTHNMGVARALADHVIVLKDGAVQEQGPAGEVLDHPRSPYTRELLGAMPRLEIGEEDAHAR